MGILAFHRKKTCPSLLVLYNSFLRP